MCSVHSKACDDRERCRWAANNLQLFVAGRIFFVFCFRTSLNWSKHRSKDFIFQPESVCYCNILFFCWIFARNALHNIFWHIDFSLHKVLSARHSTQGAFFSQCKPSLSWTVTHFFMLSSLYYKKTNPLYTFSLRYQKWSDRRNETCKAAG